MHACIMYVRTIHIHNMARVRVNSIEHKRTCCSMHASRASNKGAIKIVRCLLDAKADLEAKCTERWAAGVTARDFAMREGNEHPEVAELLREVSDCAIFIWMITDLSLVPYILFNLIKEQERLDLKFEEVHQCLAPRIRNAIQKHLPRLAMLHSEVEKAVFPLPREKLKLEIVRRELLDRAKLKAMLLEQACAVGRKRKRSERHAL